MRSASRPLALFAPFLAAIASHLASPTLAGSTPRAAVSPRGASGDLAGVVEMVAKGRSERDRSIDLRDVVVSFTPATLPEVLRPAPGRFKMTTAHKEFVPRLLVVPAGSTVEFPNQDPILHNVFSVSGRNAFDLGLVGRGPGKSWRFESAGVVRVFCNVHHSMVAYVVVVETPYFARPDAQGRFLLRGVPDGPGRLLVWHERADPLSRELAGARAAPPRLVLEVTRPRVPPHSNKLGKAYGSSRSYD